MMRLPDELRTERLLLRQWRDEDVEPLAEIYAQPEYLVHMRGHDLAGTRDQIEWFRSQWREEGLSHWAVEDVASVLHRDWWGRGLATEGGRASMRCWLDCLDDERLLSITRPENRRSRAVMERLGLTYRGEATWHGDDVVWYAIERTAISNASG